MSSLSCSLYFCSETRFELKYRCKESIPNVYIPTSIVIQDDVLWAWMSQQKLVWSKKQLQVESYWEAWRDKNASFTPVIVEGSNQIFEQRGPGL